MEGLYTSGTQRMIAGCMRSQTFLQRHFLEYDELMIPKFVAITDNQSLDG